MVTIKMEELVGVQAGLKRLAELSEDESKNFSFKMKYWISRLMKVANLKLKDYYNENTKLLEKYAKEVYNKEPDKVDADGKPLKIATGEYNFSNVTDRKSYQKDNKVILDEEVDLENVFKFKLSEIASLPIGSVILASLDPLIDNDLGDSLEKWNEIMNKEEPKLEKNNKKYLEN